ncbi:MAG: hypothetical protein ACREQD_05035, partial [Candidatus Binataceae bacterium]
MNKPANVKRESGAALLRKTDPAFPAMSILGHDKLGRRLYILAGTAFAGHTFAEDTLVPMPDAMEPGADYAVGCEGGQISVTKLVGVPDSATFIGGFHFAPGGNAIARNGGSEEQAINPWSIWDMNFRPACPDPRGMARIVMPSRLFWTDIYMLGVNHLKDGTSKFDVTIADGDDPPVNPKGGTFRKLDYETACAVMAHHGKELLGIEEFFVAAFGVKEKTAHDGNPLKTGLDALRTSKWGLMQATGNMWVWCHDGDPDVPRASIAGGSWLS